MERSRPDGRDPGAVVAARLEALASLWKLPAGSASRLASLLELVAAAPISLTSVRDPLVAVDRHVADSLSGLEVDELPVAKRIADLGSGAGFPGLVLAIALPGAHVSLVESVGKKAAFLERAVSALGLANVDVVPLRVEEWDPGLGTIDVVTARALAPLNVLIEYAAPLLTTSGLLVAWKGRRSTPEELDGAAAAAALGMSDPVPRPVASDAAERNLYVSSKVGPTPTGFPRRAGMARKRPIRASTSG